MAVLTDDISVDGSCSWVEGEGGRKRGGGKEEGRRERGGGKEGKGRRERGGGKEERKGRREGGEEGRRREGEEGEEERGWRPPIIQTSEHYSQPEGRPIVFGRGHDTPPPLSVNLAHIS